MRKISISNYRNIGIDAPAELKIPQDGGLIVLLGENNVGKSNVLSAIYALQNRILDKSDEPNFLDSVEKPYIKYTPKTPKDTNVLSYTNEVEICFDDLEKIITWYLENSYNIVGNSKIANDRIKI